MRFGVWAGSALVLGSLAAAMGGGCGLPVAARPVAAGALGTSALAETSTGSPPTRPEGGNDNGLSAASLLINSLIANPNALSVLRSSPLHTDTFKSTAPYPGMPYQLLDTAAQEVMQYLVSCALDPGVQVRYRNPLQSTAPEQVWSGEVGLCGQGSPAGSWNTGAPTEQCLQLVSSCLLSRVNGLNRRVTISMRGEPNGLFPLAARVRAREAYREDHGTPIPSFASCKRTDGGRHNCGWKSLHVGQCQGGSAVTVGAGAGAGADGCHDPVGSGGNGAMLRVCKGIYGCDNALSTRDYAGFIAEAVSTCQATGTPAVTFTCPAAGYYSVMVAPSRALSANEARIVLQAASAGSIQVAASAGSYPATEEQVFSFREGSFYGDVFRGLRPTQSYSVSPSGQIINQLQPQPQYKDVHACHSEIWNAGRVRLLDRICAGSTGNNASQCLPNMPGPCWETEAGAADGKCQPPGLVDRYQSCLGMPQTPRWQWPITVYLNDPCDLTDDPGKCALEKK